MGFVMDRILPGSRSISMTKYLDKSHPERGKIRARLKL